MYFALTRPKIGMRRPRPAVPRKRCENPPAFEPKSAGNASPVPHPRLAVLTPALTPRPLTRTLLSPGSARLYGLLPMRCGRSITVGNSGSASGRMPNACCGMRLNELLRALNTAGAATTLRGPIRKVAAAPAAKVRPRPCHIAPSFAPHGKPVFAPAYTTPPTAARDDSAFLIAPLQGCCATAESSRNSARSTGPNGRIAHGNGLMMPASANARRYRSTSPPTIAPETAPAGPVFDCHCAASGEIATSRRKSRATAAHRDDESMRVS